MRKPLLLFAVLLTAFMGIAAQAHAEGEGLKPDRTSDEKAVYDAAAKAVNLSAKAPEYTTFDWETYQYFKLTHIDSVTISRRPAGTYDDGTLLATLRSVSVGQDIAYTDLNVEADANYEYIFSVFVDGLQSTNGYVQVYTGAIPGTVTRFNASVANYAVPEVDLTVTAPETMKDGSPLAKNVSIDILTGSTWDGYNVIHTFENVEAGKTYTWKHTGLEMDQTIEYRAYARSGKNGKGSPEYAETHVGLVAPGTPVNFQATRQGNNVVLTWEKPLTGRYNGDYDAANTTYKLTRIYMDKSTDVVAANIEGYTYTDVPDVDEETCVRYELVAANSEGESTDAATSGQVTLGAPLSLPFEESFAKSQFMHKGWSTLTTQDDPYYNYTAWNLYSTNSVYYLPEDATLAVAPQDNDGGMATSLFYGYCPDGQTESLVSPHVKVDGADNIELKFYYWEMGQDATKNEIKVWVSRDDAEWQPLWTSPLKETMEPQWSEVVLPIVNTKGNTTVRIKLDAVHHTGPVTDVIIDNITLTELSAAGIGSVKAQGTAQTEYYTLSGMRVAKPAAHGTYIVKNGSSVKKITVKP